MKKIIFILIALFTNFAFSNNSQDDLHKIIEYENSFFEDSLGCYAVKDSEKSPYITLKAISNLPGSEMLEMPISTFNLESEHNNLQVDHDGNYIAHYKIIDPDKHAGIVLTTTLEPYISCDITLTPYIENKEKQNRRVRRSAFSLGRSKGVSDHIVVVGRRSGQSSLRHSSIFGRSSFKFFKTNKAKRFASKSLAEQRKALRKKHKLRRFALNDVLKNYSPLKVKVPVGSRTIKRIELEKDRMMHILQRHHPAYWDGVRKSKQTFFSKGYFASERGIERIKKDVKNILEENRHRFIGYDGGRVKINSEAKTTFKDMRPAYKLVVENGKVVQLYPKDKNVHIRDRMARLQYRFTTEPRRKHEDDYMYEALKDTGFLRDY